MMTENFGTLMRLTERKIFFPALIFILELYIIII